MAKTPDEIEDISEIEVKLKPILGIKPGVYLTVLYGGAFLFLLFMLLFFPGLKKNGTVYRIDTTPAGAAILVDDYYAGSTPAKVFVPKGEHRLTLSRPDFAVKELNLNTEGRLFGSLFVPKKEQIREMLLVESEESFFTTRLSEIFEWSLVSQFGPSYQPPRLISETVSDFYISGMVDTGLLDHFLDASLASMSGEVFIADYMRAFIKRQGNGSVPTVDTMARGINGVITLLKEEPGLSFLLGAALPEETLEAYRGSGWFRSRISHYQEQIAAFSAYTPGADERIIGGLPFALVPEGRFAMGMAGSAGMDGGLPHPESVDAFYMLKGEVTREWFSDFIEAVPRWSPDNSENLQADGLVDEWYLQDWNEDIDGDIPVGYVSYHAAAAFTSWFNDRLPVSWSGYTARLPREAEWEWAALVSSTPEELTGDIFADGPASISGRPGVEQLMGSLWEWCSTWFHPADYYVKPWEGRHEETLYPPFDLGAEAVVRGGSWANAEEDRVTHVSRGSQRPEWCTPFTGFRLVLARNQDG